MAQKKEKGEKDSGFSEAIKKVVSIGVGAAFMTEDAIKSFLSEFQLPKDIVSGIQKNARSAKADFLEVSVFCMIALQIVCLASTALGPFFLYAPIPLKPMTHLAPLYLAPFSTLSFWFLHSLRKSAFLN